MIAITAYSYYKDTYMRIVATELKNFRCFGARRIELDAPLVLLTGNNGVGKTSFLEALHYACYLRSFKTHTPKELINLTNAGFSVGITLSDNYGFDALAVTLEGSKRSLKLNQKPVASYKELYEIYKVVTMSEEDLEIVKGAPAIRRSYIDQIMTVIDPSSIGLLRKYKAVLENRNALLQSQHASIESYELWTGQLLDLAVLIQAKRKEILNKLQDNITSLVQEVLSHHYTVTLQYTESRSYALGDIRDVTALFEGHPRLQGSEFMQRRSLIGSHLDDISIIFEDRSSRLYASRGQQKLIVFLLKLAQLKLFSNDNDPKAIFLIDDFMTDFDEAKIQLLLNLIQQFATQVIITSPSENGFLKDQLVSQGALLIQL